MKIFIRDLSALYINERKRVRFSVTFAEDDGEPVNTEHGWTIDADRTVRPPTTRTARGGYYRLMDPSEKFLARLAAAVGEMPWVKRQLGPKVEGSNGDGTERTDEGIEL